jgi:hypothetical protein
MFFVENAISVNNIFLCKLFKTQDLYLEVPSKVSEIGASFSLYTETFGAACIVEVDAHCFEE